MSKILLTLMIIMSFSFGQLIINEIDYDQPSTDDAEFVELTGPAGTYSQVVLQLINGNNNEVYGTYELGTVTLSDETDGYGFYVVGATTVPNVDFSEGFPASNAIQNGAPDGVELFVDGVLTDAVSYEGSMMDSQGGTMEMAVDDSDNYPESGEGESVGRIGLDGTPWMVSANSPGAVNDGQVMSDEVNTPPVADAGDDQLVLGGDTVTLDGSGSYDSDGMIVYYIWQQTAGTPVELTGSEEPVASFTAPEESGLLTFELTVYDDLADTDTDEVFVTICSSGLVTIAEARGYAEGACAMIQGVVTSPNFQSSNSEYTIQDATAGIVLFQYGTDLIVNYGDEVQVMGTITEYNGKLEIVAENLDDVTILGPGAIPEPQIITVSDLENNGENYESELVIIENVTLADGSWPGEGSSANLTITDNGIAETTMRIDSDTEIDGSPEPVWPVNVTGVGGQYYSYQLMPRFISDFEETGGNQLPVADAGEDQIAEPGDLVTLDGSGSYDPDGSIAGYIWEQTDGPTVALSDYEEPVVTFTAPGSNATLIFRLTAIDNEGAMGMDDVAVVVTQGTMTIAEMQETSEIGSACYDSPYNGQSVMVSGIVTAVAPGSYPNFYMQDAEGDAWAGVYVYDTSVDPTVGDEITLSASVSEYYGFTELTSVTSSIVVSSGNEIEPLDITTGELAGGCSLSGEMLEGMLVRITDAVVTQAANNYNEWYVDDGSGECQIDDNMFDGASPSPMVGDSYPVIIGVVDYSYDQYGVLPRGSFDFEGGGTVDEISLYELNYTTEMGTENDCYPSPYNGQIITTSGIVTGVRPDPDYPTFFIQDINDNSYCGVYVYVPEGFEVLALSDEVTLTAEVSEYFGWTELTNIESYSTAPSDTWVDPIPITTSQISGGCSESGESLESMLVILSGVTVVEAPNDYGEWVVDDGSGECQIDDLIYDGEDIAVEVGDTFESITGIIRYSYGEFMVLPRNADDLVTSSGCVHDGDVNMDGSTDVLDVVSIVGFILGTVEFTDQQYCAADTNEDGSVDVLDVVLVVSWILGTRTVDDATAAEIILTDDGARLSSNGFIGGIEMVLTHDSDFRIDLDQNNYLNQYSTDDQTTRLVIIHPGTALFSAEGNFEIESVLAVTSQDYIDAVVIENFALLSAYPNPFNPQTTISYRVTQPNAVRLDVYDLLGSHVGTLVQGVQTAGETYEVIWNGQNAAGASVPSGIYFVRLENGSDVLTQKITLLR